MREPTVGQATVEQIKEFNSDAYKVIFDLGVSSQIEKLESIKNENEGLKVEINKFKNETTIRSMASKLNLEEKGEELIKEGVSVENALASLITASTENQGKPNKEKLESFRQAASAQVGSVPAGDEDNEAKKAVQSWDGALKFVKTQNPGLTTKEAVKEAKKQFPEYAVAPSNYK